MDFMMIFWMITAALAAVVLFTFIGFVPGTDETSVLLPISLAVVLAGVAAPVVLSFFIASIVTLNLTNTMPTALVGLPGGVMSSPMIEQSIFLKNEGKSTVLIKKIAAAAVIGVAISIPVSLLLANLLIPFANIIKPYAAYLFIVGAIFLALIGKNKILALIAIIPLAILFQSVRHLYWGLGVVPQEKSITVSFFLAITVGPLLVSLLGLLNKKTMDEQLVEGYNEIVIPHEDEKQKSINPWKILTKEERKNASIGALVVNFLFVLSPVGLTILFGNLFKRKKKSAVDDAFSQVSTMSAVIQSTYVSGIIIPLLALGIPLSPVSLGPGAALFNAPPVLSLESNLHHRLSGLEFTVAVLIGAIIAIVIGYFIITFFARKITNFVLKKIPHESVLGLFLAFIVLLAYMDGGLLNVFGVLTIGIVTGSLNKMGVNYGVQFMSLYAAPLLVELLSKVV